jgi:hypothetical protein
MANRFYGNTPTLVQGQSARAEAVEAKHNEVEGGFLAVANEMNRAIRFTDGTPNEAAFQMAATSAQRANKLLGFSAAGNPDLFSSTFVWRGNWTSSAFYAVNDVVRGPESANYSIYIVTTSHTSAGSIATDISAGRLAVMIDLQEMQRFIRRFQIVTTNYNAVPGDDLFVDVTAGAVTITLPAAPVLSDQPISICHAGGNVAANNITIARNGKLIMGLAEDMTVNTGNASFELAFVNDTLGWRLVKGT